MLVPWDKVSDYIEPVGSDPISQERVLFEDLIVSSGQVAWSCDGTRVEVRLEGEVQAAADPPLR